MAARPPPPCGDDRLGAKPRARWGSQSRSAPFHDVFRRVYQESLSVARQPYGLDPHPCPCGLPSPRLKILGRAEHEFVLAGRRWLPYDVQAAIEDERPDLAGATFAISSEGLAAGRLRLLFQAPEDGSTTPIEEGLVRHLRDRFGVEVEMLFPRSLPLMMKGVTPIVSERDVP